MPYNPGPNRGCNPQLLSTKSAGVITDYYSYTTRSGPTDYDSFEYSLELLEKPANPIFQKIRALETITSSDKEIFAKYIMLMRKRVPRRRMNAQNLWPDVLADFKKESGIIEQLDQFRADPKYQTEPMRTNLSKAYEVVEKVLNTTMPDEILHRSMIEESSLVPVIINMAWRFLIAPPGSAFFTGDCPVFFFEWAGLNKPYSEMTFPISSRIALSLSWHHEFGEGFFPVDHNVVKEINKRTASVASTWLFSSTESRDILDVLDRPGDGYSSLYPNDGSIT